MQGSSYSCDDYIDALFNTEGSYIECEADISKCYWKDDNAFYNDPKYAHIPADYAIGGDVYEYFCGGEDLALVKKPRTQTRMEKQPVAVDRMEQEKTRKQAIAGALIMQGSFGYSCDQYVDTLLNTEESLLECEADISMCYWKESSAFSDEPDFADIPAMYAIGGEYYDLFCGGEDLALVKKPRTQSRMEKQPVAVDRMKQE